MSADIQGARTAQQWRPTGEASNLTGYAPALAAVAAVAARHHEEVDAATFAAWGVDYLKVGGRVCLCVLWCGGGACVG